MKKGDLLTLSFFKKSRWMSVVIALIFLVNTCAPAWAREGNFGTTTALGSLGRGALAGVVTAVSCYVDPVAGAVGSITGDLVGLYMYYYSYSSYGETEIEIGSMKITKGQLYSMVAGTVASLGASYISGALSGSSVDSLSGDVSKTTASVSDAGTSLVDSTVSSASSSASQGFISSIISSAIQLPVSIVKSFVEFFKDFFKVSLGTALKNLGAALWKAVWNDFLVAIWNGLSTTLGDIWKFITHPVGSIKDIWKGITRKAGPTANPYYRYGTEGAIGKALVNMGGDLGVGLIRLVVSEYVKQNLEKEVIFKNGKKFSGLLDETIAGMIGSMVSNYVGASMNVMIMKSLGEAFGWDVDNQLGFLSRGEVDPNGVVKVKGNTGEDITVSEVYNLTGGKVNPEELYVFKRAGGDLKVTGKELLDNNSGLDGQLQSYDKGTQSMSNMSESGSKNLSSGDNITIQNVSNAGTKVDDKGNVVCDKADKDGNLLVRLDDGSTVVVNIKQLKTEDINNLKTYNNAAEGYAKAFGQYGTLVMADPNKSITITVMDKESGTPKNIKVPIGWLAGNKDFFAEKNSGTDNIQLKTGEVETISKDRLTGTYKITLKTGEVITTSASNLNEQVLGQLKIYTTKLNSSNYSRLFQLTGGLPYNINGKDMNTMGVFRASYEEIGRAHV